MVEQNLKKYKDDEYNKYIKYKDSKNYEQIRIDYLNEEDDYESESFIVDECCYYCGLHMSDVNEIFVDLERDVYICKECGTEHGAKIIRCREY